jgi:hypothetical protein
MICMPPKAAAFGRYRHCFGRKISSRPRRYVAGKIFRRSGPRLWTSAAAVQRLAFLLL